MRAVGIVANFAPLGVGTQRKFILSSPRGEMGTGDLCRVPLAAVRHGRASKLQGRDRVGIVEVSCGYRAYTEANLQGRDLVRVVGIVAPFAPLGVGISGKFVLSSPRVETGTGDLCRVPLAAVCHWRSRQTSGTIPFWGL